MGVQMMEARNEADVILIICAAINTIACAGVMLHHSSASFALHQMARQGLVWLACLGLGIVVAAAFFDVLEYIGIRAAVGGLGVLAVGLCLGGWMNIWLIRKLAKWYVKHGHR